MLSALSVLSVLSVLERLAVPAALSVPANECAAELVGTSGSVAGRARSSAVPAVPAGSAVVAEPAVSAVAGAAESVALAAGSVGFTGFRLRPVSVTVTVAADDVSGAELPAHGGPTWRLGSGRHPSTGSHGVAGLGRCLIG